jgi:lipopolysaccharide export LptBFGC system permease protein LptF
VLFATVVISAALFVFDEFYLPAANRRQEALLSIIKDKPTQTFSRPDRQWISGQTNNAGDPVRIFYYQYFNAETDRFANLTVFEFDPANFTLQRRIFAASARWDPQVNNWVFDNGWQRTFSGETIASYQPFTVATFPEIKEQPSYFKKEYIPSQEMSYNELSTYIADLKHSGFDTKRLNVQLDKKIAYPLITLVMAILAIPFALSMGKKGSLTGIATAIGLAITYWVVALIFESFGNVNTLPAVLAAWTPDILFGITGAYLLLRTPT